VGFAGWVMGVTPLADWDQDGVGRFSRQPAASVMATNKTAPARRGAEWENKSIRETGISLRGVVLW
jgi:hypothetical protein